MYGPVARTKSHSLLDQIAGISPKKLRKQGKSTFPLFDCHLPEISGKQNNLICVDQATRVFVNISDCRSPDDAVTEAWKKAIWMTVPASTLLTGTAK